MSPMHVAVRAIAHSAARCRAIRLACVPILAIACQSAAAQFGGTPGDYNFDGIVSAADYTTWRNLLSGIGGTFLPNDTGTIGVADPADYDYWKAHYGEGFGSSATGDPSSVMITPEPGGMTIIGIAGMLALLFRGRRKRPTCSVASRSPAKS